MSSKHKSATPTHELQGEPSAAGRQANWFLRQFIVASVAVVAFGIVLLKDQPQPSTAVPVTPTSLASAVGSPAAQSAPAAVAGPIRPSSPSDQLNQALAGGKPVLVFIHSTTCQSCKDMMKTVEQVYPEFADEVALVDVDVNDNANGPLTQRLKLRYIPTIVVFDKTGKTAQNVGAMKTDAFRTFLRQRALGDDMEWDFSVIQHISPLALILVFAGGVLTSIGPCNMAMIPLIIGFVGGSGDLSRGRSFVLATTFATGLAITFMLLGIVVSFVGGLMGAGHAWFYYIVAGICILIGLQLLGVIRLPMPDFLADRRQRLTWHGVRGALALGLVSGLVASQCATPVLAAILTHVMAEGAVAYGALLLFVYALGRGVLIVAAGTFTGVLIQLRAIGHWSGVLEKVSGVIIIGVGLYLIWLA